MTETPEIPATDRRMLEVLICPQTHTTLKYDAQAQELVSRTPLRTRGVLYEHLFGGSSELLENNHQTLLRGMHLPEQLHGFVNTRTPLL